MSRPEILTQVEQVVHIPPLHSLPLVASNSLVICLILISNEEDVYDQTSSPSDF